MKADLFCSSPRNRSNENSFFYGALSVFAPILVGALGRAAAEAVIVFAAQAARKSAARYSQFSFHSLPLCLYFLLIFCADAVSAAFAAVGVLICLVIVK